MLGILSRGMSQMRTVCVLSRKGGTGKTTVSTSLALAGHLRGQKVLLADIDPQHSSYASLSVRDGSGPAVESTAGGKLFHLKTAAELNYTDLMLIDCPAGLDASVYQAIHVADLCLVVTRPNYLDLASALQAIVVLRQLRKPALIILNQAPGTREGQEASATVKAREALRFVKYPVAETALCSRVAYSRATASGRTAEESEPRSAAAHELSALWSEVSDYFSAEVRVPSHKGLASLQHPHERDGDRIAISGLESLS